MITDEDLKKMELVNLDDETRANMINYLESIILDNASDVLTSMLSDEQVDQFNTVNENHPEDAMSWLASAIPNYTQVIEQIKNETMENLISKRDNVLTLYRKKYN